MFLNTLAIDEKRVRTILKTLLKLVQQKPMEEEDMEITKVLKSEKNL